MSIVVGQGLGKYYGAQDVFENVEFSIARGDKIGLVGPNGAGKTTLLRIILGLEEPSRGSVFRARGLRLGYLPQKPSFPSGRTLKEEMLSVFASLRAQELALQALADELATAQDPRAAMARYAEAEQRFALAGGYTYESRIKYVLRGLGFGPEYDDWPISRLSGGQVMRALLAKLLLQEPELLVLDEPTNYLDLEALGWLESYLQEWPHSLLVVSHDRYFLDKVVSKVWELNHGSLEVYRGHYSSYAEQKRARLERRQREYEEQQKQIAKSEEFIRRYKAGQRSKEARGREKRLQRLERIEPPRPERTLRVHMATSLRAGDHVLMSDGALIGFPGVAGACKNGDAAGEQRVLFQTGEFLILRGHRVALLGANGSGKTTFLRTIVGQIKPLAGQIRLGASVRLGYLPQTQDWLDPNKTVLEQLLASGDIRPDQARHLLGRFLFSGDEVNKSVGALSGGELSRLALAILTMQGANFLLLDEPTTHLDVASQEILQNVLQDFNGTMLFVSHDRYLVDALATHVWVIRDGRLWQHEGNYSSYIAEFGSTQGRPSQAAPSSPSSMRGERRRLERQMERAAQRRAARVATLEAEIHRLEQELSTMSGLISLASSNKDVPRLHALTLEYQRLEATLAERMEEWEQLAGSEVGQD